jgi:outer membrane protein assembly factor BamB
MPSSVFFPSAFSFPMGGLTKHLSRQCRTHGSVFDSGANPARGRAVVLAKAYVFSSPAIAGDLAYFGSHNGRFYAVNVKTGTLVWEFETDAAKKDPFKVLNADGSLNQEVLYAPVFGDFEDMYLALFKFMSIGGIVSSPALDKGKAYFGSMDGNLYALQ